MVTPTGSGKNAVVPSDVSVLVSRLLSDEIVHSQLDGLLRRHSNQVCQNTSTPYHLASVSPVKTTCSLLLANGLKAVPRTLILHRTRRLSLPSTTPNNTHLEARLHHIQRIHNGSTHNSSNTTNDQLLNKRDLSHHSPSSSPHLLDLLLRHSLLRNETRDF